MLHKINGSGGGGDGVLVYVSRLTDDMLLAFL